MNTDKIIRGNCVFGIGLRDTIGITVEQGNRKVSVLIDYHYRAKQWFLSGICIKKDDEVLLSSLIVPSIWLPGGRRGQPDDPINGFIDLYEKIARAIFDGADIILLAKYCTGQLQYRLIKQIIQEAIGEGGKSK
jgi:hypothetical protein